MSTNATHAPAIKEKQWNLPVSFDGDGNPVSLRDFVESRKSSVSFSSLNEDQRARLTVMRIEAQPKLELGMIDSGIIDKERAIAEVKAKSRIGKRLIEIETRMILYLLDQAIHEKNDR